MYFLACSKCKHLNEVKTEHLTFCKNCGSKLANNYRNWKEKNSHKSFADYKQEVCINQEQHQALESKKQKGQNHMKKSTLFGIVLAAVLVMTLSILTPIVIPMLMQPKLENLANTEWKKYSMSNIGISIKSPITLTQDPSMMSKLPDQVKEVIVSAENYSSNQNFQKIMLMVNTLSFQPNTPFSLEGAAQGSLQNLQQQVGDANLSFDRKEIYLDDIPGIQIKGEYTKMGTTYGYYLLTYLQNSTTCQVILSYDKSDEQGPIIAQKIIESIQRY